MARATPYSPLPVKFGGVNNQRPPEEVGVALVVGANVDLMDDGALRRRGGYTASSITGAAVHSLWGSKDEAFGFVVDGDILSRIDSVLGVTAVGQLPASTPVAYCEVNDTVACVQSAGIRFVSSGAFVTYTLPPALDSETQFKALTSTITGGVSAAYYRGRLYIVTEDGLVYTDPYNIGVVDTRDYLLPLPFACTHIFALTTGVWVCGPTGSAYLRGDSPKTFEYIGYPHLGVIAGAMADASLWADMPQAEAAIVLATEGVYLLADGGGAKELTGGAYEPPVVGSGPAIIRDINGATQLLACFTYQADGDRYTDKPMTVTTLEV